jgi:hypothetical protein
MCKAPTLAFRWHSKGQQFQRMNDNRPGVSRFDQAVYVKFAVNNQEQGQ